MLKSYFKITFRNFKRQKAYSLINMIGLAIGLTISLLIFFWVKDELSYDRYHEHADSLFRVVNAEISPSGEKHYSEPTPPILAPFLKGNFPEIVHASRWFTPKFSIGNDKKKFVEIVGMVDREFFEMFSFTFAKGRPQNALPEPTSIILTESLAHKLFRDEDPMDKVIQVEGQAGYMVSAVIKDLPDNTHMLRCGAFLQIQLLQSWGRKLDHWGDESFKTYVQLVENADPDMLRNKIANVYKDNIAGSRSQIDLEPVTRIHLDPLGGGGSIAHIYVLSLMALFILLIASINYMNLATARSTKRAREVGIRKAVGANRQQLARQFFGESFFMVFISMIVALFLTHLSLPLFSRIAGKYLLISYSIGDVSILALITLGIGLLSGSYPAFVLSGFKPVRALHGGAQSGGGHSFRRALVVLQFSLSILLIIANLVIFQQLKFMQDKPLGYHPENIICMTLDEQIGQNYQAIKSQLLQNPDILAITKMNTTLDSRESTITFENLQWNNKTEAHDQTILSLMGADEDFLKTFDVKMKEGRFFGKRLPSGQAREIVINETAAKVMGLEHPLEADIYYAGKRLTCIGVMKDFHYQSLHNKIEPLMLMENWAVDCFAARISSHHFPDTISFIEGTIGKTVPGYKIEYEFLDDRLANLYSAENRTGSIAFVMMLVAIMISSMGLLGLVSFSAEQRTKEIGIRKVLGSTPIGIVSLLLKDFSRWVLLANVFAWPIAYILSKNWLNGFAYRIDLGMGTFVLAGSGALMIAMLAAGYQATKATLVDPVKALKYE